MRAIVAGVIVGLCLTAVPADAGQQTQPPRGGGIRAADGDVIVIEGDAKVRLVRRREATVSAIHNPAERWLILMVDYAQTSKPPDGGIDTEFSFHEVTGWPLGERWSGAVVIDEYTFAGEGPYIPSLGLTTDSGLVQFLGGPQASLFRDPAAAHIVSFRGSGRGGAGNRPAAEVEPRLVSQASRNAQNNARVPGNINTGISMSIEEAGRLQASPPQAGSQPVRVGGNIKTPTKVVHVDPVVPARAVQAGISGMVIVEAVIGVDGSITDIKVLRSIPLLDGAAVEAVRQWKFSPTTLNGVPVPVIMTLTVNFPQ